jgi:hypothetical protein
MLEIGGEQASGISVLNECVKGACIRHSNLHNSVLVDVNFMPL